MIDISKLTWHKYTEPAAGWDGYLEDESGNVCAWLGTDGSVTPQEQIQGSDSDDDENNLSPFGNIAWKLN